jgi:hypothetical protein
MKSRGTISLLIATLMICLAAPAWGKALLEDDHSKAEKAGRTVTGGSVIPGKNGLKAWRGNSASEPGDDVLVYDFVPGKDFLPERGTIEILFQRTRTGGHVQYVRTGSVYEAILDLVREDRKDALALYVVWKDERDTSTTSLVIWGSEYGKFSDVFGKRISLGRVVQVGEMVHLALTWGPGGAKDNHVFINGKEVPPDDPSQREGNLTRYIGNVRWLKIGADSTDPKMWPGGRNPIYGAAIYKIVVHDDVVTTFDLSAVIPTIRNVSDDSFQVARISGKLVAGDTVTATLVAVPGGTASFDLGDVKGIAMEEVPATEGGPGIPAVDNGTYQGSYTIRPGDDYEDGYIVGHFVSADNVVADPVTSDSKWTIETKPQVTFDIDRKDMPADSSTKARIKLVAEDANGDPVQGRHLKLTLATTEEYTGTVGAGDFGENVGATVETRWKGETDAWGEVEFDYVAGFAAKTVILTAKDLDSGGVTVDYITAYKEAAIDIALTPPVNRAAARRGVQYIVKVEASRTELTADGRSRSVIRATVMDPNGTPVAGDPVTFTLSSENGTLRTIKETTDSAGVATAEYRAGKKIGIVVVTDGDLAQCPGECEHHPSLGRPGKDLSQGPAGDPSRGRILPFGPRGEGDRHQRQPEPGYEGRVPRGQGWRETRLCRPGDGSVRRCDEPVHERDGSGGGDHRGDRSVEGSHGDGTGEGEERSVCPVFAGGRRDPGGEVAQEKGRLLRQGRPAGGIHGRAERNRVCDRRPLRRHTGGDLRRVLGQRGGGPDPGGDPSRKMRYTVWTRPADSSTDFRDPQIVEDHGIVIVFSLPVEDQVHHAGPRGCAERKGVCFPVSRPL